MKHSHLIITANLGTLKAFRILESSVAHRHAAELIHDSDYAGSHTKMSEQLSDRAGRFSGSGDGNSPSHSFPENNHLKDHLKEGVIKQIAHDIDGLIGNSTDEFIYLALPKDISKAVNKHLTTKSAERITKEHSGDIVKEPVEKIRTIFSV